MDNLIAKLYKSTKTVLSNKDLALIWEENNKDKLKNKISYYVKKGVLIRLTRNIFAKNNKFNVKELATSLYTPSYISFETVLRENGVIFQHYESIFVAYRKAKTMTILEHKITFRKLKDIVLFNPTGILNKENYSIATLERAFLDMIYLFPNYYFDNLEPINWRKCQELVGIYKNNELKKRLQEYIKKYDK
jgi:predicted transcriptional regulator of viral defense system